MSAFCMVVWQLTCLPHKAILVPKHKHCPHNLLMGCSRCGSCTSNRKKKSRVGALRTLTKAPVLPKVEPHSASLLRDASTRYRAYPKVSRNPNFCVGCFGLIISKNSAAAASKMGKNGQKQFFLCDFFCGTDFCAGCWTKIFLRFFAFWGLGLIHFVATARNRAYIGLWDCSPFLHRHTNVNQLDSGVAVHSTDKHQQAWFRPTSPPGETLGPQFTPLYQQPTNKFESQQDWQPNIPN